MDAARIALLDEAGANAMPASSAWHLDGWVLRHSPDVPFRRANSVLTLGAGDALTLDERLSVVQSLADRTGRPARLQVARHARPSGLDEALEARGFAVEAPVDVCVADSAAVRAATRSHQGVERYGGPDERWIAAWRDTDTSDRPVELFADGYRAMLTRVAPELLAVSVGSVGVAIGVRERGCVGVFSMKTHPAHRRQGVAGALLHEIATWALEGGAEQMYLQVEEANDDARALYEGTGFVPHHRYWYRTRGL